MSIFLYRISSKILFFKKLIRRTIDNMIGRTAHIRFLESESFIKMLIYNLDNIFS